MLDLVGHPDDLGHVVGFLMQRLMTITVDLDIKHQFKQANKAVVSSGPCGRVVKRVVS